MRVADAVRATSVPHRLKVGDKFTDADGNWEVVRVPEKMDNNTVCLYLLPFPARDHQRARAYLYSRNVSLTLIRK
jgi:hypothetical protein